MADAGSAPPADGVRKLHLDIDGYSLEAQLGDGRAGPVYLARQRSPERRVVLRVLLRRLPDERRLARARHELEQLLRIEQGGIPRLLAWDTCHDGSGDHPFLVCECVEGRPLPAWCERAGLDLRGRARLIAQVARTVHALHSRGVVHGALAGHNVLVTACGEVKVLDFGVGAWRHAVAPAASAAAGLSAGAAAAGEGPEVQEDPAGDPAGDIQALGVLAGQLFADAARAAEGARSARVPPDLVAIVTRAAAAPGRERYASALELALDLECWLGHLPVAARPSSAGHSLRLFAFRHRIAASLAGVFTVVAVAGLAAALHMGLGQRAALARAQARAQELAAANRFLGHTLLTSERQRSSPRPDSVRSALDQAREQLLAAQDMPDAVDVRIRALLGETYASLGDLATGLPMQEEALERAEASQDLDPLVRKQVAIGLARTLADAGQPARAIKLMKPLLNDGPGSDSDSRLNWVRVRCVLTQASIALADATGAETYSRGLDNLAEQWFGAMAEPALNVRANRVMIAYMREHYRDVLVAAQRLSDDIARQVGPQHPVRANMLALAGLGAREMDNIPLARRLFLEAARVSEGLYGPDASKTLDNQRRVAEIDHDLHPAERAPVAELRRVMQVEASQHGPASSETAVATVSFASAALDLPDPASQAEGERLLQEMVDAMNQGSAPRNLSTLKAEFALARRKQQTGQTGQALHMYREVRNIASQTLGPQHQLVFRSGTATAELLEQLRLAGEARQEYAELLPLLRRAYGEKDPRTRQVAQRLAALGSAGDVR